MRRGWWEWKRERGSVLGVGWLGAFELEDLVLQRVRGLGEVRGNGTLEGLESVVVLSRLGC